MKNRTCTYCLGIQTVSRCRCKWLCTPGEHGEQFWSHLHRGTGQTAAKFQVHFYFPSYAVIQLIHKRNLHSVNSLYGWYMLFTVVCSVCPFGCSSVPQGSELVQQLWSIFLLILAIFFTSEALQTGCSSCSFCRFSFASAINLDSCFFGVK